MSGSPPDFIDHKPANPEPNPADRQGLADGGVWTDGANKRGFLHPITTTERENRARGAEKRSRAARVHAGPGQ